MVTSKIKKIIITLGLFTAVCFGFAATTDLSMRFLDKAEAAFEEDNIEEA